MANSVPRTPRHRLSNVSLLSDPETPDSSSATLYGMGPAIEEPVSPSEHLGHRRALPSMVSVSRSDLQDMLSRARQTQQEVSHLVKTLEKLLEGQY